MNPWQTPQFFFKLHVLLWWEDHVQTLISQDQTWPSILDKGLQSRTLKASKGICQDWKANRGIFILLENKKGNLSANLRNCFTIRKRVSSCQASSLEFFLLVIGKVTTRWQLFKSSVKNIHLLSQIAIPELSEIVLLGQGGCFSRSLSPLPPVKSTVGSW